MRRLLLEAYLLTQLIWGIPGLDFNRCVSAAELITRPAVRGENGSASANAPSSIGYGVSDQSVPDTGNVSGNGRRYAFSSRASDLVAVDTNQTEDIFVYDSERKTNIIVSVAEDGSMANGRSSTPVISEDGNFVAFVSLANNLVPGLPKEGLSKHRVFIKDLRTNEIDLASPEDTTTVAGEIRTPAISADGQFVAYQRGLDVYLWNRTELRTTHIGRTASLVKGWTISSGGEYVAFFQSNPTEPRRLVQLFSRVTGSIRLVSPGGELVAILSFSKGGRKLLYSTIRPDDLIVYDTVTEQSLSLASVEGAAPLSYGAINPEGTVVAYESAAPDGGLKLLDLATTNRTSIFSREEAGPVWPMATNQSLSFSSDGRFLAFVSKSTELLTKGTNNPANVFLYDRETSQLELLSPSLDGGPGNGASKQVQVSLDGSYVYFQSSASNLVAEDFNSGDDLFRYGNQATRLLRLSLIRASEPDKWILRWSSNPGYKYQLQSSSSLGLNSFEDMGGLIIPEGSFGTTEVSVGAAGQRFFRIEMRE